jgi:antitoxin StbD
MQRIEAEFVVSVSDLKKSPSSVMEHSRGSPVAVLNHNRVMAYMLDPRTYEAMLEKLDDQALIEIIKSRADEVGVPVELNEIWVGVFAVRFEGMAKAGVDD